VPYAAEGTASHQHRLEACTVCGRLAQCAVMLSCWKHAQWRNSILLFVLVSEDNTSVHV